MRTHIASIFTLLLTAAAGCGAVDDGACPTAEQNDEVACTLDVCNAESGAWAHIPDNSICGAGMRCDPTGGCVAAGGLTGRAYLFGHTDHSGISVSVDGLEGATTTTGADGGWTLSGIPAGTYTITYAKATWYTEKQAGVGVLAEAATSPVDVELRRAREGATGIDTIPQQGYTFYTPDKKHALVRYYDWLFGTYTYAAYSLENPTKQVILLDFDVYGQFEERNIANTHLLYKSVNGDTVWSRPLDGGPPMILASAPPDQYLTIEGISGPYAIIKKERAAAFTEYALWVVKVDGSQVMTGAPVYVTPDANHQYRGLVMNDTTAVLLLSNSIATPPNDAVANTPMRRIDLATGTSTPVNTGFPTNQAFAISVSPDKSYMMGYLQQPGIWNRAFIMPISGTAAPSIAPDYGLGNGVARTSDMPTNNFTVWHADNSGVVYSTTSYPLSAGGNAEGHLKVWFTNQGTPTNLVTAGNYYNAPGNINGWHVRQKAVIYHDNVFIYSALRVVSAHSTVPASFPLDTNNVDINQDAAAITETPTSTYMVWTEDSSANSSTRAKIFAASIPNPLTAAPTITQLGGTLSAQCQFEGVLSNTTFWHLCGDTGVMNGYTANSTTSGGTIMQVRPGLVALPEADRLAFRLYDGKLYSSPNTGTLTDVKLISNTWDALENVVSPRPLIAHEKWVFFRDSNNDYLRVSNADGSTIDEPLSYCAPDSYWWSSGYERNYKRAGDKSHVLFGNLNCGAVNYGDVYVPTANLP